VFRIQIETFSTSFVAFVFIEGDEKRSPALLIIYVREQSKLLGVATLEDDNAEKWRLTTTSR
jgi:hypothetical protein